MIYGKIGAKNFAGLVESADRFCGISSTAALGFRTAAALRVSCDACDKQIHDIDVAIYLGDRLNAGRFAVLDTREVPAGKTFISMAGQRVGLGTKESVHARRLPLSTDDFIGFSKDGNTVLVYSGDEKKVDFLLKLRLRDLYTLRLSNITERVANALTAVDGTLFPRIDSKWNWTRKLICLAALECLLRGLHLWGSSACDEYRNEAAIKLMLGDLLFDGIDGLDEYNMYSNDAEQRVKDSELLVTCGHWLAGGGTEIADGLRAGSLSERALVDWKKTLETDLGVVLPSLTKQGNLRGARSAHAATL
ncbi:hypothetical protein FACS1894208_12580 [Clostridia bacterium]|nr:hypothetical protein FACS1894208_12580 [Clostridia bacterium]